MTGLEYGKANSILKELGVPDRDLKKIACRLDLSAYDSCYLATAEMLRAPLFTEDSRLLRAAPKIARSLSASMPWK